MLWALLHVLPGWQRPVRPMHACRERRFLRTSFEQILFLWANIHRFSNSCQAFAFRLSICPSFAIMAWSTGRKMATQQGIHPDQHHRDSPRPPAWSWRGGWRGEHV
ncbi:hypothetical protein GWL_46000 [Herbaspirillum sp. GW103]|nr:hypothetical protein GWL_46000 [Herbaspirillum sp. GW103]